MNVLLVIDMQNDFINGALGSKAAESIVEGIYNKVKGFKGKVFFTRDTHNSDYLETEEGKNLPLEHCIKGTKGWEICDKLLPFVGEGSFDKPSFGAKNLAQYLLDLDSSEKIESITLVGLCTDICVITNALLMKSFFPNTPIYVESSLCAGVSSVSHKRALEAMSMCQIHIK